MPMGSATLLPTWGCWTRMVSVCWSDICNAFQFDNSYGAFSQFSVSQVHRVPYNTNLKRLSYLQGTGRGCAYPSRLSFLRIGLATGTCHAWPAPALSKQQLSRDIRSS